jgi:hypothetical protein
MVQEWESEQQKWGQKHPEEKNKHFANIFLKSLQTKILMTGFHQHCGSVDLDFRVHQLSGKRKISGLNLMDKLRISFVDCQTNIPSGKRLQKTMENHHF